MTEFDETVEKAVKDAYLEGRGHGKQAIKDILSVLLTAESLEEVQELIQETLQALEKTE